MAGRQGGESCRPAPVAVLSHQNGCRHVAWSQPGACRLVYGAPMDSRRWREEAAALITPYVKASDGVAWDEQGDITVVIDCRAAWDLAHALVVMGGPLPKPGNAIGAGLVLGGAAKVVRNRGPACPGGLALVKVDHPDPPADPPLLYWSGPEPVPGWADPVPDPEADRRPRVEYKIIHMVPPTTAGGRTEFITEAQMQVPAEWIAPAEQGDSEVDHD